MVLLPFRSSVLGIFIKLRTTLPKKQQNISTKSEIRITETVSRKCFRFSTVFFVHRFAQLLKKTIKKTEKSDLPNAPTGTNFLPKTTVRVDDLNIIYGRKMVHRQKKKKKNTSGIKYLMI